MISVVMPGYNVEKTVGEDLEALLKQTKQFKEKVEIIFVDDGSTDNTVKVVKRFRIKVIKQIHAGPAVARNRGIKTAKGRIVIFLDADCKISKNWLKEIVKPFEDEKIAGVGVRYETWNKYSWVARFVGYEIEQRQNKMDRDVDFLASYSTAFRRNILLKLGGFDIKFKIASAEDNDLSYKIKNLGYKLVFLKNIFVYHKHPESLINYFKKQYNHAKWRTVLWKEDIRNLKIPRGDKYAGRNTFALQPFLSLFASLVAILLLYTLYIINPFLGAIPIVFLYGFAFGMNTPTAIMVWDKGDKFVALLIPLLFFVRNFVWFLGLGAGILGLSIRILKKVK